MHLFSRRIVNYPANAIFPSHVLASPALLAAFVFNLIPASPRRLSQNLNQEMSDLKYSKYSPLQTKRGAMQWVWPF